MAGLPYKTGLNPVNRGGNGVVQGILRVAQTSVAAPAMFKGDPLAISPNGAVVLAVSSGQQIIGVAQGFFWLDPTTGQPVESRHKPASTSSRAGLYDGIRFKAGAATAGAAVRYIDDLDQEYAVRATTSVAVAKLGDKMAWVRTGGSTTTGQSNGKVSIQTPTSAMFLRVAGVLRAQENIITSALGQATVDNDWGTTSTVVIVKIADTVGL